MSNSDSPAFRPLRLSGSQPFTQQQGVFIMIGERTNVAGSPKFATLIKQGKYEEAVAVARQQVENGANVIDINMDEGMIDGVAAMTRFLQLLGSEPEVAKVPFMVDSSKWEVIEAGLKCVQGKGIVNSISLKEGEEKFRQNAKTVLQYGAAVVVMAFDEQGQAATFEDKIRICERAYRILTEKSVSPRRTSSSTPTSSPSAPAWRSTTITPSTSSRRRAGSKQNLPHAKVSGGVTNISFSFRGNNPVREAMHTAFLYHAIPAGLDMGIVNAGMLEVYEEIDPELKSSSKTSCSTAGPTPPNGSSSSPKSSKRQAQGKAPPRRRRRVAQRHRRGAADARAGQGHRHLHRSRHRGSAPETTAARCPSSKARSWTA